MHGMNEFDFYEGSVYKGGVFVFGSNLSGRHGKGAALEARSKHGAIYGKHVGMQGNSYAIPTKDVLMRPLQLELIESYIEDFVEFTIQNQHLRFYVTAVGCGLAGYKGGVIAPLFVNAHHCFFPLVWKPFLV